MMNKLYVLKGRSERSDLLLPVSEYGSGDWYAFWGNEHIESVEGYYRKIKSALGDRKISSYYRGRGLGKVEFGAADIMIGDADYQCGTWRVFAGVNDLCEMIREVRHV